MIENNNDIFQALRESNIDDDIFQALLSCDGEEWANRASSIHRLITLHSPHLSLQSYQDEIVNLVNSDDFQSIEKLLMAFCVLPVQSNTESRVITLLKLTSQIKGSLNHWNALHDNLLDYFCSNSIDTDKKPSEVVE